MLICHLMIMITASAENLRFWVIRCDAQTCIYITTKAVMREKVAGMQLKQQSEAEQHRKSINTEPSPAHKSFIMNQVLPSMLLWRVSDHRCFHFNQVIL